MTCQIADIRVDGATAPVGIDTPPRVTWALSSDGPAVQERYRVIVRDGEELIADSDEQFGPSNRWDLSSVLVSLRRYVVTVWVRTSRGDATDSTEFTTGVLDEAEWLAARWITASESDDDPAPILRRVFDVDVESSRCLLAIAVAGCAAVRFNGVELDERLLGGITDFTQRVQYSVLDLSSLVRDGRNELVVELGNAFYGMTSANTWNWETAPWHAIPSVKAILEVTHPSGVRQLVTDEEWDAALGQTTYNDFFGGETFDARREVKWRHPLVATGPSGRLESARQPRIRVTERLEFLSATQVGEAWVLDFGRVVSGWANLAVRAASGQEIRLHYGEKLRADGLPNNDDEMEYFAGRFQTDVFIAAGTGSIEHWHPQFGWKGFRYVAVEGLQSGAPSPNQVTASRAHTDVDIVGSFECSNDLLNRIHAITVNTLLNNLHGIPTDTPMYEKNGWTGDGMVAAEMLLLNFDASSLLDKWVDDIVDTTTADGTPSVIAPDGGWTMDWEPCPTWHSALVLIPWWLYLYTGDSRILLRTYQNIAQYVAAEFVRSEEGIARSTLGDWLSPETSPGGGNPPEDRRVAATAYLFAQCVAVADIARVVGDAAGAETFEGYAGVVQDAFLREFFDATSGIIRSPDDDAFLHENFEDAPQIVRSPGGIRIRQAHQALAVGLDVLPISQRRDALAALVHDIKARDDHLNTGLLGTKYLLPVLSDNGYHDVAMAVALQTTYPSWGYWLQNDATTTWEHWHLASRSRNHYSLGTIDEWLYTHILGVRPITPGFEQISVSIRPTPELTWARGCVATPNGLLRVSWGLSDSGFTLDLTIPIGSTGRIELDLSFLNKASGTRSMVVASGDHRIVWDDAVAAG